MNIVLSPHFDDACFSLFAQMAAQGPLVVNLFSLTEHTAQRSGLPRDIAARAAVVSRLRREEDDRVLAALGVRSLALGLPEPALRGKHPFDRSDPDPCLDQLRRSLFPVLDSLLPREGDGRRHSVYCPASIGGHRDHFLALLAMAAYRARAPRRFRLLFYEDLHYASNPVLRRRGLNRLAAQFPGLPLVPSCHFLSAREERAKMEAVAGYASQWARPPEKAAFVPASGVTSSLHEIVWRLDET